MSFLEYLGLVKRHWLATIILTALVCGSSIFLVQWKNAKPFETTIFLTIGNVWESGTGNAAGPAENAQAADQFSETVQGWFKNPQFLDKIKKSSGVTSDIGSRKQEKQNVIVTFPSGSVQEAQKVASNMQTILENEINGYDLKTNSKFTAAIFEVNTEEKPLSLLLFALIGLAGGILVSSFALYGYEYLFEKIPVKSRP